MFTKASFGKLILEFKDGDLWFKCGDEVCNENIEYYLNKYGRKIHKASVNELIEHFKTKEEQ